MFFGNVMHLAALVFDSSKDCRSVESLCSWFGINCKSKNLKFDQEQSILASSRMELQLVDDRGDALSKSEQVAPKEDFDCSDASLESEGEFNSFGCSYEPFS